MLSLLLLAQVAPDPDNVTEFAKFIMDAVRSGNYPLVAALGVIAVVALLKRFGGNKIPFLHTDAGGSLLVLLTGAAGAIATALLAGTPISVALILTGLGVGFSAAGGYGMLKKVLMPLIQQLMAKLGPGKTLAEEQTAVTAAGDAAVAAAPAKGLASITKLEKL